MKLIYLHGFASGPGSKKAQWFAKRFAEQGLAVEIPDLAAGRFEDLTLTGQLAVIDRCAGGAGVGLIGSSLGGYLAALYAARHANVERVCLMAPGFGFASRWPVKLGEEKLKAWRETGTLPFYHYGEGRDRLLKYNLIEDGLRYEEYPEVRQPCLIFHGEHDDTVPAEWSREFAKGKQNVELHVVDSDHELLNVLDPMWERIYPFFTRS